MKQGLRQTKLAERKKTKQHIKGFYKILGDMDSIAGQLDPSIEYTEENIDSHVLPIYGRELDNMEKMVLLGKMHREVTNNIEAKHGEQ